MSKVELHKKVCERIHETYKAKNADYGDSFAKVRAVVPNAIVVRLMDKMERIKTLMKGNYIPKVKDEKLDDTLLDLANYCIMEVIEREADAERNREAIEKRLRGESNA